jgi:hypothetical protein
MKDFGKFALPHLFGLFAYTIILAIFDKTSGGGMIILLALAIALHVLICFIISISNFVNSRKTEGGYFLLISLLILLVGFGSCVSFFTLDIH